MGIYVLVIRLRKDTTVNIGALGQIAFEKGLFAYVGSAQKNLRQRVKRHLRKEKRNFWHIDYLLTSDAAKVVKVFFKEGGKEEECHVAREISGKGETVIGFGCSDCHCNGHLFYAKDFNFLSEKMENFDFKKRPERQNTKLI